MYGRYAAVAAEAALKAGAIQKARYGQQIEVHHKGEIDLVTEVDRACEEAIVSVLLSRFPDHDIVTEETRPELHGSRHVWLIDPLDGTTNFAHAYPFFCSSVALVEDGVVVAGAVHDPMKDELFTGVRGGGAYLNGRRLHVSAASDLLQSLLITGFPYDVRTNVPEKLRVFRRFMGEAQAVRRDGAAALDLCYIAASRADGFWEEKLYPWDMAVGCLMVEEAGGRASRFDGSSVNPLHSDELVAANPLLHKLMLDVLRQEFGALVDTRRVTGTE